MHVFCCILQFHCLVISLVKKCWNYVVTLLPYLSHVFFFFFSFFFLSSSFYFWKYDDLLYTKVTDQRDKDLFKVDSIMAV